MDAVFVELPPFERYRAALLDDEGFRSLQLSLMRNPLVGEVIQDTGGLRKMRFADRHRGKGKRGGIRIIYYWWVGGSQFWLFTLYDKNTQDDLNTEQRKILKRLLEAETSARKAL